MKDNDRLQITQEHLRSLLSYIPEYGIFTWKDTGLRAGFIAARHINLGHFQTKEEAAAAYKSKAEELYGEFARV